MKWKIFAAVATLLSSLAAVALLWLWVRSESEEYVISYYALDDQGQMRTVGVFTCAETLEITFSRCSLVDVFSIDGIPLRSAKGFDKCSYPNAAHVKDTDGWQKGHHFIGFGYSRNVESHGPGGNATDLTIYVPFWGLIVIAMIFPVATSKHCLRCTYRKSRGFCVKCGYDLRETPLRCPECGTVPRRN